MRKHRRRKGKAALGVIALLAAAVAGYVLITGWLKDRPALNYALNTAGTAAPVYPDADFAVLSDLHIYDRSLGDEGEAFQHALYSDRKLLLDSQDLLDYAIGEILDSPARFVLVSGDLTKDGERVCHEIAAKKLARLTEAGLKVYVVPGNHDVNNPGAVSYSGGGTTPVDTVTAGEFERIYADFGYGDALERDPDSLSYVAEPSDGLWLLALDACRYRENQPGHKEIVSGKVSQATADWIARVLQNAVLYQKAVIVMIHHGVVEHWKGQSRLHPDYLIKDYTRFGEFLASYNVRITFTGHYHAQDITRGDFGDKYIYDIETGALVTAPCPIRFCSLKDNIFSVESVTIANKLHPGSDFAEKGLAFVKETVARETEKILRGYKASEKDAGLIANAVGDAFSAHYSGDENPARRSFVDKGRLSLWGRFILRTQQYVPDGLWDDLPPADGAVSFRLG